MVRSALAVLFAVSLTALVFPLAASAKEDPKLLEAAQQQDLPRVRALLEAGADINTRSRYGATALFFACDRGDRKIVELLLANGADVNLRDTFYRSSATGRTLSKAAESPVHQEIALLLLAHGSEETAAALRTGVRLGNLKLVQAAVEAGGLSRSDLEGALTKAREENQREITAYLEPRLAALPPAEESFQLSPEELRPFVGEYEGKDGGSKARIALTGESLTVQASGRPPVLLVPASATTFTIAEVPGLTLTFSGRGGLIETLVQSYGGEDTVFRRVVAKTEAPPPEEDEEPLPALPAAEPLPAINWPSFRGPGASGIGDGQGIPWQWNGEKGSNIRWKTPIPGMALSSPIVWGDQVFVTTAVSEQAETTFRTGLYGDVDSVDDDSIHAFHVYALDRKSGKILWQREAGKGRPKVKRHSKSSHANPTPVTDGRHLVVSFASEGLFCYSLDGELLWHKDLGVLSSGWFYDPTYEWGFASSPILHEGKVILQVDIQKNSFLAAFDAASGKELWRTARQEIPSWATPAVLPSTKTGEPDEIITNAPTIRGYDALTGKELWSLTPNAEIVVGTPVVADGIAYFTGGYPPARPIYAVKPGSRGDLTLPEGESASSQILWSSQRGGTYIPTPIVYRGLLYLLNNNGRLAAYDAKSGELAYRHRVGRGESFSGSPVASDGRLYLTTEDGRTFVIRAGETYEVLAQNELGEVVMTVPAISKGLLILRGIDHVYGIGLEEADLPAASLESR